VSGFLAHEDNDWFLQVFEDVLRFALCRRYFNDLLDGVLKSILPSHKEHKEAIGRKPKLINVLSNVCKGRIFSFLEADCCDH